MTTRNGLLEFEAAFKAFRDGYEETTEHALPRNQASGQQDAEVLLRHLDKAVFDFIHRHRDNQSRKLHYQAVRGAFRQGPEISPSSGFHRDSHIQIALRDLDCVLGWFLPHAAKLMTERACQWSRTTLAQLEAAHPKPRERT